MKWGLKWINKDPFETGISRICRFGSLLQIREIPVKNGAFLVIFRRHFDRKGFSSNFFRFLRNLKKSLENQKIEKIRFFQKYDKKKKWGLKITKNAPF